MSKPVYPEVKPINPVVEIVKLVCDAEIPIYVRPGDSGISLFNTNTVNLTPFSVGMALTGIAINIPEGYEGQIRSRSGLAYREQVFVLNSPGTIDSNYRGEIGIILASFNHKPVSFPPGSALAQLVICPVTSATLVEVDKFSDPTLTVRGSQAYGSSGMTKQEQLESKNWTLNNNQLETEQAVW